MANYNEINYQENMIKKSFFVYVEPDKLTAYMYLISSLSDVYCLMIQLPFLP
jgi:hypothetical protein